ncbi:TetR/AcrR family transcriptional regulator [Brachybacterium sacelli]|uniref:TetR/AcrR family transcriptional regulator n=1 Tax=Brachybacterium sacelli TaxID=173364 RepID=UPI0024795283|nr:TetR family transcriptional regulator [Brachybacterium sacelli]
MATVSRTESARLRAAEACSALYISRGTTALTVSQICEEIALPQRTFYRYFPVKADSIGPIFDWSTRTFTMSITAASPDATLAEILEDAFRAMFDGEHAERTRALFPLVLADAEMWSLFLRTVHDGERTLTPVLAPRLGIPDTSLRARTASAAVASSTRIALECMVTEGVDLVEHFMDLLAGFGLVPDQDRSV